ncbi:28S ribosomal protein S5, mitochondrial [Marasmius tenuissimus]|nr:28S ribosomal protein S5, mitochondrial [Marasmius tenuissimus]
MHRLSRQVASSTRLLRNKKASPLLQCRRHYVSPKLWSLPQSLSQGPYAEIYKLLRPDLKQEEAARIGAALLKSATNDLQFERAQMVLETNYPNLDQDALQAEITRLVESGETFESLLKAPESSTKSSESAHPGLKTFTASSTEEFAQALESEEAQEAIVMLTREEREKFNDLAVGVMTKEVGETDFSSMRKIAELLSQYGFKLEITGKEDPHAADKAQYQQQTFMTEDEAELARRRAIAEANPLAQTDDGEARSPFPNLMSSDPLMDSRDVLDLPATLEHPYHNRVVVRNHTSMFHEAMALDGFDFDDPNWVPEKTDLSEEEVTLNESAGVSSSVATDKFYSFPLVQRWTTQQTGKGKIKHFQVFHVAGDGNGMLGLGIGMDEERENAFQKAKIDALRNMDYVDRFENRTIWTDMKSKFRSTQIIMRPRPTGFGLRCGPVMHQVLKAAGIKDISGKIWGSRNPVMIMQGLMKMLHRGHAPLGMGNGIGGKGKRLAKGSGMRTQFDVERDRGRKLVNLRK